MIAPPVAKPKAKTASNDISALHRVAPFGQRHGVHPVQDAGLASINAKGGPPGPSWDFSKIPVFSSGRAEPIQMPPHFSAPRVPFQAKLVVGQVNDPLEHEADRVADQVMRMPAPEAALTSAPAKVSRKCDACEEVEKLQQKPAGPGTAAGEAPGIVHDVLRSPGQPLDATTRSFFEPRFGQDFSGVRVHTGASAAQSAQDVNANAYTVGHNIVFGAGRFMPKTHEGRHLIAHELTHVVQQSRVDGNGSRQSNQRRGLSSISVSQPQPRSNSTAPQPSQVGGRQIQCDKKRAEKKLSISEALLKELAMWPQQAHTYWKRLSDGEKIAVRMVMGERYGQAFGDAFVKFTKSGAKLESHHYGPGFPEHTPEWFKERGFQLAQRDTVNDWWVHPSGYDVMANRGIPWGKTVAQTSPKPTPPANTSSDNSKEMLALSLDAIRGDIEEGKQRQEDLVRQKKAMDRMNITSDAFKTAYDAYVDGLNKGKNRVKEQLDSIDDMETSVKEMGGDVSAIEAAREDLQEISIWFDVNADLLRMEGRVPINADFK